MNGFFIFAISYKLEKSGLFKITNKVMGKHGIYEAEVLFNGFKETKPFFPSHWSQEKVISKVMEAYDNFKANGSKYVLESDGKIFVEGVTTEGIKIEMYFTKKGKITSAYPSTYNFL